MSLYELNDIKRDRIPYSSDYVWHLPIWSPYMTNTIPHNLKSAAMISLFTTAMVEPVCHYWGSLKALNMVYEWPKNTKQYNIYLKEGFKTFLFWSMLGKKMTFTWVQNTMDYGMRLAMFQYTWGATWSPVNVADYNIFKYASFSFASAFASGWCGIPFEVARKAYFADLTWPANLRKGYRSPLHALVKIPFNEGPLYLFRGGLLTYLGNSVFTGVTFTAYTWLKNKLFFLSLYNDISYNWIKFWEISFAFTLGSLAGYPLYGLKHFMETLPKERGGQDTFKGSSWNAFKWFRIYHDIYHTNMFNGYQAWFRRQGITFLFTIWIADEFGFFDNFKSEQNTANNIMGTGESD